MFSSRFPEMYYVRLHVLAVGSEMVKARTIRDHLDRCTLGKELLEIGT